MEEHSIAGVHVKLNFCAIIYIYKKRNEERKKQRTNACKIEVLWHVLGVGFSLVNAPI